VPRPWGMAASRQNKHHSFELQHQQQQQGRPTFFPVISEPAPVAGMYCSNMYSTCCKHQRVVSTTRPGISCASVLVSYHGLPDDTPDMHRERSGCETALERLRRWCRSVLLLSRPMRAGMRKDCEVSAHCPPTTSHKAMTARAMLLSTKRLLYCCCQTCVCPCAPTGHMRIWRTGFRMCARQHLCGCAQDAGIR
jgi:hypothetical protein